MQMEALEAVHRESRRLPPIQKVSVPEVKKTLHLKYRLLYPSLQLRVWVTGKKNTLFMLNFFTPT